MRRLSPILLQAESANEVNLLSATSGSQIVEFAIALPLLIVLAVGIFDFGNAFNIKQKLVNASREGARIASNQPTAGLNPPAAGTCGAPTSVCAIRDAVDNALISGGVRDCGLATANATAAGALAWTFPADASCPGVPFFLKVDRGATFSPVTPLPPPFQPVYTIEATRITLSYPYQWVFNRVVHLVVSSATYPATTQLTSVAVMQNLN